jgi:hypothetical protein
MQLRTGRKKLAPAINFGHGVQNGRKIKEITRMYDCVYMEEYVTAFAIGSVAGGLLEIARKPDQSCFRNFNPTALIPMLACNIYGWSCVLTHALLNHMHSVPWAIKLPLLLILMVGLEGNAGYISRSFFDRKTWQYEEKMLPGFDRYASVMTSLVFSFGICGYCYGIYRPMSFNYLHK